MKKVAGILLVSLAGLLTVGTVLYSHRAVCNRKDILDSRALRIVDEMSSAPLRAYTKIRLNASPERVFNYLSSETDLPRWMPGLNSVEYDHSASISMGQLDQGSQRTMTFGEQVEIEEIAQFERPNVIAYRIMEGVPLENHLAVMVIEEGMNGGSILSWHQAFEIQKSSVMGWLMPFLVRRFLEDAQNNLLEEFGGTAIAAC